MVIVSYITCTLHPKLYNSTLCKKVLRDFVCFFMCLYENREWKKKKQHLLTNNTSRIILYIKIKSCHVLQFTPSKTEPLFIQNNTWYGVLCSFTMQFGICRFMHQRYTNLAIFMIYKNLNFIFFFVVVVAVKITRKIYSFKVCMYVPFFNIFK